MANKWIYWDGGECPVERVTLVDVIHRSGLHFYSQNAGIHFSESVDLNLNGRAYSWSHTLYDEDIIAYRLSEVEK